LMASPNSTTIPPHSFFTGQMPFLPPNQQHQSTEGKSKLNNIWNFENLDLKKWLTDITVTGFKLFWIDKESSNHSCLQCLTLLVGWQKGIWPVKNGVTVAIVILPLMFQSSPIIALLLFKATEGRLCPCLCAPRRCRNTDITENWQPNYYCYD